MLICIIFFLIMCILLLVVQMNVEQKRGDDTSRMGIMTREKKVSWRGVKTEYFWNKKEKEPTLQNL